MKILREENKIQILLYVINSHDVQSCLHEGSIFEIFTVYTKLAEMAILASKNLRTLKQKLPPVGLDLMEGIITGL